jgi:hypothetical protein
MDRSARRRLIDNALELIQSGSLVAVPAEDYFDGNTDDRSFGRGMQTSRDIAVAEYAEAFRAIAARPDVHSVWIAIHDVLDDSRPEDREMWPKAHQAFVITSAPAAQVESWLEPQEPRYADAEWGPLLPSAGVRRMPWAELPPGMRAVLVEML